MSSVVQCMLWCYEWNAGYFLAFSICSPHQQLVCGLQGPAPWDAGCAKAWRALPSSCTSITGHYYVRPSALQCSPEAIAASVELS